MDALQTRLYGEICRIPLIDPHTHVNPLNGVSLHLDDILGYHYYTELSHSSGMGQSPLAAGVSPDERIRKIAAFLPRIENTAQYSWLIDIAKSFYGFAHDHVDASNVDELASLVRQRSAAAGWQDEIFRRSNVEAIFLTNDFDESLEGFDRARFVPCLRADELVFKLGAPGVLGRLAKATGVQIGDAAGLRKALAELVNRFKSRGSRACAIGLTPEFTPASRTVAEMDWMVRAVATGQQLAAAEAAQVSHFVFWTLAELCGELGLTFDLMIGAVRGIYPAGVKGGQDLFNRLNSLAQYAELFNAFPKAKFAVSIIDSAENPELVAFSWILPNVYTAGHWWYANGPALIDRDLRQRLTAVPRVKQIGYYSDAYKLEFVLPKFNMYRRVLARVLADEFVINRGWSEEKTLGLARDVLRTNVERIFYGKEC